MSLQDLHEAIEGFAPPAYPQAVLPTAHLDFSKTLTITQSQSQSSPLDLGVYGLLGVVTPAALETNTGRLSFQAATASTGTYRDVYVDGNKAFLTCTVAQYALVSSHFQALVRGMRYIKITAESTTGVAISQTTTTRVFTAILTTR